MNTSPSLRAKLSTAALSLVLVCAFVAFRKISAAHSWFEVVFWVACLIRLPFIAFRGVYRVMWLQLLWGWSLLLATVALVLLCLFVYHGIELVCGLATMLVALCGGYLLVADASIRAYRRRQAT